MGTSRSSDATRRLKLLIVLCVMRYRSLVMAENVELPLTPSRRRHIDSFAPTQYWNYFMLTREDMHRMFGLLNFPVVVHFKNRSYMSGEEVFCRGLFELRTGVNQFIIALACIDHIPLYIIPLIYTGLYIIYFYILTATILTATMIYICS